MGVFQQLPDGIRADTEVSASVQMRCSHWREPTRCHDAVMYERKNSFMDSLFHAKTSNRLVVLVAVFCLVSTGAIAQLATGSIQGLISDKTGAVIPNATITVTNSSTGVARIGVSNAEGLYGVPNLAPGDYTVTVEAKDFSKQVAQHVIVVVNGQEAANFALDPGRATETVSVIKPFISSYT